MYIYNYSRDTYEFTKRTKAHIDQRVPGEFLCPAFATKIKPPSPKCNEVAVFDEKRGEWLIYPDYRGEKFFVGRVYHEIIHIGVVPPKNRRPRPENAAMSYFKKVLGLYK